MLKKSKVIQVFFTLLLDITIVCFCMYVMDLVDYQRVFLSAFVGGMTEESVVSDIFNCI